MSVPTTPQTQGIKYNIESDEVSFGLVLDAVTFARMLAAYDKDLTQITQPGDLSFNDWLVAVVLDWVEEVEKPVARR